MVYGNVDSRIYANMAHICICQNYANLAFSIYVPTTICEHMFAYRNAHNVPPCMPTGVRISDDIL